jgi:hypothetical protein
VSRHLIRLERNVHSTQFVVYQWETGAPAGGARRRTRLAAFSSFELAQQAYPEAVSAAEKESR